MKSGLLIHCYSCTEPNYERVIWGQPPDKPGRLVTAVKVILEEEIDVALNCGREGREEADYLYQHLEQLKYFRIYPVLQLYSAEEIKEILDRVLTVRDKGNPHNTAHEARYAGRFFDKAGVKKVCLVSSPDHISRCLRDAIINWQKNYPVLAANVFATASRTLYSEDGPGGRGVAKMENVVIIEPPFYEPIGKLAQEIFKFKDNLEALAEVKETLERHE